MLPQPAPNQDILARRDEIVAGSKVVTSALRPTVIVSAWAAVATIKPAAAVVRSRCSRGILLPFTCWLVVRGPPGCSCRSIGGLGLQPRHRAGAARRMSRRKRSQILHDRGRIEGGQRTRVVGNQGDGAIRVAILQRLNDRRVVACDMFEVALVAVAKRHDLMDA